MKAIVNDTLASMGRKGDTMIAHINPREAAILKVLGGRGGINPRTGYLEFWDADSDASADAAAEGGMGGGFDGGFGGADQGGLSDTAMGDSGMGGGGWGADQGGFSDTAMEGPDVSMGGYDENFGGYGLGGIDTVSDAEARSAIGAGGLMTGPSLSDVDFSGVNSLSGYGKAGLYGYGLGGLPGAAMGLLGYGLYQGATGFSSLSPAEQQAFRDSMDEPMSDRGGEGGVTVAPEATFSATGTQPAQSSKRKIIDNRYNRFNRGIVTEV